MSKLVPICSCAAVPCTTCANVYLFSVHLCTSAQETAANNPKFGQLLNKILTCYSRQCYMYYSKYHSAIYAVS